jgi:hypothetical protein
MSAVIAGSATLTAVQLQSLNAGNSVHVKADGLTVVIHPPVRTTFFMWPLGPAATVSKES